MDTDARLSELEAQVQTLTIEFNHLLSHVIRAGVMVQPCGFHLVEEAVAEAYGIDVWDFYGGIPGGQPRGHEADIAEARATLYNFHRTFLRESYGRISLQYNISKDTIRRSPLSWETLHLQTDRMTALEKKRYRNSGENLIRRLTEISASGVTLDNRLMAAMRGLNQVFSAPNTLSKLTYDHAGTQ